MHRNMKTKKKVINKKSISMKKIKVLLAGCLMSVVLLFHMSAYAQSTRIVSQDISWEQLIGKQMILARYGGLEDGFFKWYRHTNPAKDKPVEQFMLTDKEHFVWQYSLNGDFERSCRIEGRDLILSEKLFDNERFRIIFAMNEMVYTLGDDGITRAFYIYNPKPTTEMLPLSYQHKKGFCDGELDDLLQYATDNTYLKGFPMGRHYLNACKLTPEMKKFLSEPVSPKFPVGSDVKEYDVELFPEGRPYLSDVNQRLAEDCNFASIMTEMAYMYPLFIKNIISKKKDGTFRVKMFDPEGKRITVAVGNKFPFYKDVTIYSGGMDSKPSWVTVLEVAAIKYITAYKILSGLEGCNAEMVTPMFTGDGRSFCIQPGKLSQEDLTRMITTCLNNGMMVNGGFLKSDVPLDSHETVADHGHTFMLPIEEDALFSIRNPWGREPNWHIMNVRKADKEVTDMIDIRVISPGVAQKYLGK